MKRKISLVVGYSGAGFHGIQWNRGLRTIESEIMGALLATGCVTEVNAQDPAKIDMKAASRTDKGVHAVSNVVSLKICREPTEALLGELRAEMAGRGVHLYRMERVTKRFVGHKAAKSRIYKYFVPTCYLQEGDYDRESRELIERRAREAAGEALDEGASPAAGPADPARLCSSFIDAVGLYKGTHDFKNFTVKSTQVGTKRFIKDVAVDGPVAVDGVEYLEVTFHGQSFLLHQIRKMIGLAVLVSRYGRGRMAEIYEQAFASDLHVPKAPPSFLYLQRIIFGDEKLGASEEEMREYEEERIKPEVFRKENLLEWEKFLDAVRYHRENFGMFI